ncbi:DNA repair protein RecO [Candidatus Beckwithbacteria bacterium CG10_big_fil_rev_8_21_14_0_10_34_10]|uniref:DNA repair protein RecO n=1 Tax=Candidatus Beckwithbacteria bacterium CG10_big_fil_rev_8_21_14_0_10_34_10 TaxID=1974495 RepID=A0A2H0W934_9BACT|nr:MAG: DNA repair protein RecO [Candidatus Beckwithbacteria bacterium CG10_big_fil_rev_8_21_14_0_10_34_10]
MRPKTFKVQAIILKRINFSEADRILTAYSKQYGKLSLIAKGVRKVKSRKAPSLELFNLVDIYSARGKNLDIITETQLLNSFNSFKKDLAKISLAYEFCELTDRFLQDNQKNTRVFEVLKQSLERLNKENSNLKALEKEFKIELLKNTGFGLPQSLDIKDLNNHLENIMEKKLNSSSFLKSIS